MAERNHSKRRREARASDRATPERLMAAANRAIQVMAAGIESEAEFEAILAGARPGTREQIRAKLEPHLTFRTHSLILLP